MLFNKYFSAKCAMLLNSLGAKVGFIRPTGLNVLTLVIISVGSRFFTLQLVQWSTISPLIVNSRIRLSCRGREDPPSLIKCHKRASNHDHTL